MALKKEIEQDLVQIDGVQYVNPSWAASAKNDFSIVLEHAAPVDVIDEIEAVLPNGYRLDCFGASQEHLAMIEGSKVTL